MGILLILAIVAIVKIYYLFYIGFALEQAYGIYTEITLLIYILSEIFFLRKSFTFFKINSVLIVIAGIATMAFYLKSSILTIVTPLSLIIIYAGFVLSVLYKIKKQKNEADEGKVIFKKSKLFKRHKDKEN